MNSALLGAYGVGVFAWGWVVDRYGTKIGYAWSIATWSVAAAAPALVASVGGFLGARMFLGVSEGGNFPAAIKAVALWFPRSERAFATAIFNSGTNVGAIVAPAIVPVIALAFGWRSVFVLAGVAGFLWLFLWLPFYDVPEKQPRVSRAEFDYIRRDKDVGTIVGLGGLAGSTGGSRVRSVGRTQTDLHHGLAQGTDGIRSGQSSGVRLPSRDLPDLCRDGIRRPGGGERRHQFVVAQFRAVEERADVAVHGTALGLETRMKRVESRG